VNLNLNLNKEFYHHHFYNIYSKRRMSFFQMSRIAISTLKLDPGWIQLIKGKSLGKMRMLTMWGC